jgi:hypothetical protein
VWRAYKQKNARCKYLLPKKCGRAVSFCFWVEPRSPSVSGNRREGRSGSPAPLWFQKKFGEKKRRWYSRANAKSRERLERPSGFARRHG